MKKILLLLIIPIQLFAQKNNTDYFNTGLAFTGVGMVLSTLPQNGYLSFDGNFTRQEAYLVGGIWLVSFAVLNDKVHIAEFNTSNNKWLRFGLYTSSIVFDAIGDARFDMGYKTNGKFYQAISTASLVAIPVFTRFESKNEAIRFLISAPLIRFSMFDYVYNNERGLPLDYQGTTSYYDNMLPSEKLTGYLKGISMIIGLTMVF